MSFEILSLFSFIIGILTYENFSPIIVLSFFPLFFLPKFNKKLLFCFFLFFFLGHLITNYKYKNKLNWNVDFSKISEIEGDVILVKEKPFEKDLIVNVKKIIANGEYYNWNGKIIVKTKEKIEFLPGEDLRVKDLIIFEIKPPKNPFEFDYRKFMNRQGIFLQAKSDNIEIIQTKNLKLIFSYLRKKIENKIEKYMRFNSDGCELVKLLTIGSDDIPDFLRIIGVRTGIYHLFVISGIHIVFIIFFLKVIFIPFQKINNVKPFLFPLIIFIFLWFYSFLCGFKIPITRAVTMVSFYLISEILGKEIDPVKSLIIACIFLLFLNPFYIYSLSFLLSFLSTFGILIIYRKINNFFKKKNFISNLFIATISAQIFILPLLFYNFGYFYPIGILSNLIFTPIVGLITITSFASLAIPILFYPLCFMTDSFLKILVLFSNLSPKINFCFPLFFVFIYYFFLLFLISTIKKYIKLGVIFLFVILCFFYPFKKLNNEEIIFFSSKSSIILFYSKGRGILIIPERIENKDYYGEIIRKISKNKKIKIEKIILFGNKFSDDLFFVSNFKESKIYIPQFMNCSVFFKKNNEIIRIVDDEKIILNNAEFIFKDGNLIIKYDDIKILILISENIGDFLIEEKYFIIYPVKFKKKIYNFNSIFLILKKDTPKFENLKNLCQTYYLDKSALILNLKSKVIKYWGEK